MTDPVKLTQDLVCCPSVTPVDAGAQKVLTDILEVLDFDIHHLKFGEIQNFFARLGESGPHFCFLGHTDVVPVGDEASWTHPPFSGAIDGGMVYGRGTADMKGNIACFVAALVRFIEKYGAPKGSISLLITGDEEKEAVDGTVKVLEWMKNHNHLPDVSLVGEPTNPKELGEMIKIGRRGSINGTLRVKGKQGHTAYQEKADNPLPRLVKLVDALASYEFDQGTEFFPPTNLEVTTIDVGNPAANVIPEKGQAKFNVRFNDQWSARTLDQKIREVLDSVGVAYELETISNAESFMTEPGAFTTILQDAIEEVTGKRPALTTEGGTSDARFAAPYGVVAEFGLVNETIHQVDERVSVESLYGLTEIYERILVHYFKP